MKGHRQAGTGGSTYICLGRCLMDQEEVQEGEEGQDFLFHFGGRGCFLPKVFSYAPIGRCVLASWGGGHSHLI